MKTNELRLGNWVNINNSPHQIYRIDYKEVNLIKMGYLAICEIEKLQPIKLTEELLVNLFGKPRTNGNKFDIYTIPTNGIEIQDRRKSALPTPTICILKFGVHICNIKYLHQLQNAYYLLTNKELEVEL